MIIILTYYADGSGKPEVGFFPDVPEQASHVISALLAASQAARLVEVYEIEDLTLEPLELTAETK